MPAAAERPAPSSLIGPVALIVAGIALLVLVLLRWNLTGWGGWVWLAGFVAMNLIRAPHAKRTRENRIVDRRKGLGETLMLAAMFATMLLLPLLHLATGLFAFADYALPIWATALGALLQLAFLWPFWRSHADLGRNWSATLELREDHGLVTDGVYARIRHPMYAAIWLAALAQPLLIANWIAGALVVPAFAVMYLVRTPREEAMMRDRFGGTYDAYAARAGRLWPKLGGGV